MSENEIKTKSMEKLLSIDFVRTKSSRIYAMGHTGKSRVMYVIFQNGNIYKYLDITKTAFKEVLASESIGKAFQELVIRGGYAFKRMFLKRSQTIEPPENLTKK